MNNSIISSGVLSLWKQTLDIWHFLSSFGSTKQTQQLKNGVGRC